MKRKSKHLLDDVRFEMVPLSKNSEGKLVGGFADVELFSEGQNNSGCSNNCPNQCGNNQYSNCGCQNICTTTIAPTTPQPTTIIPIVTM